MNISVEKAKEIREQIGATHIILFAHAADGSQSIATHGGTEEQAYQAADFGNALKKAMGWPSELCQSTPQQRAEWNRKSASEIRAQIDALKQEKENYLAEGDRIGLTPDNRDEIDALYISARQCDYAIQQLEWVLELDGNVAQEPPRLYPATLTPELDEVLGWPNFKCGPYAEIFRAAGYEIPRKAEREQAFILHWLTGLVLKHGAGWHDQGSIELTALRDKIAEQGSQ